jgi:hypothetical protein
MERRKVPPIGRNLSYVGDLEQAVRPIDPGSRSPRSDLVESCKYVSVCLPHQHHGTGSKSEPPGF